MYVYVYFKPNLLYTIYAAETRSKFDALRFQFDLRALQKGFRIEPTAASHQWFVICFFSVRESTNMLQIIYGVKSTFMLDLYVCFILYSGFINLLIIVVVERVWFHVCGKSIARVQCNLIVGLVRWVHFIDSYPRHCFW